jgi:uncharacterized glyoxalase superfamily protein PhnB
MKNTLRGLHIFARDVRASVAFYEQCGLEFESTSDEFARVRSDRAALEIGSHRLTRGYDPGFEPQAGGSTALQIGVESRDAVDAIYSKLVAAGHQSQLPPFDAFWGARYSEVRDPDGNLVGFQSPIDDLKKSHPPLE